MGWAILRAFAGGPRGVPPCSVLCTSCVEPPVLVPGGGCLGMVHAGGFAPLGGGLCGTPGLGNVLPVGGASLPGVFLGGLASLFQADPSAV